MEAENFKIKVRRHPLIAVVLLAAGLAGVGVGIWIEQYGLVAVGALALVLGGFTYMNPALIVTPEAVELHNLFGNTSRTIPHDGLNRLQIKEGKLVIEHAGLRATLPRPKANVLHPADWKFLSESLEKARTLRK